MRENGEDVLFSFSSKPYQMLAAVHENQFFPRENLIRLYTEILGSAHAGVWKNDTPTFHYF